MDEPTFYLPFTNLSTMKDEVDYSEGEKRFDCIRYNTEAVCTLRRVVLGVIQGVNYYTSQNKRVKPREFHHSHFLRSPSLVRRLFP